MICFEAIQRKNTEEGAIKVDDYVLTTTKRFGGLPVKVMSVLAIKKKLSKDKRAYVFFNGSTGIYKLLVLSPHSEPHLDSVGFDRQRDIRPGD